MLLFGVTGGLCAFVRGFELLLALRLLLGMGVRDRRYRFAFGILARGFVIIRMIITPDPRRPHGLGQCSCIQAGKQCDAYYLTLLSTDTAPVLVDSCPP